MNTTDAALEWAAAVLADAHETSARTPEVGWERVREWSRVRRLDLAQAAAQAAAQASVPPPARRVWLKELPGGLRSEVDVAQTLAGAGLLPQGWVLAASPAQGWLLCADGGETVYERWGDGEEDAGARVARPWQEALERYGAVQRAAEPLAQVLVQRGVPDLRPGAIGAVAESLVRDFAPGLVRLLARWEADAEVLAGSGIRPSVQHEDLHGGNVFADSLAPFDWGDASVSHPWMSLAVAVQEPWEQAAQAAFVRGWGRDPEDPEVAATVASARRLGCVSRAASWARVHDAVGTPERFGDPVAAWLARGEEW